MKNDKKYLELGAGFNLGEQSIRAFTTEGQEEYNKIIQKIKSEYSEDKMIYKEYLTEDFLTDPKYALPIGGSCINLDQFTEKWLSKSDSKKDQISEIGLPKITHFIFQQWISSLIKDGEINSKNIGTFSDWLLSFCFPYFGINFWKKPKMLAVNRFAMNLTSDSNRSATRDKLKHLTFSPYQLYSRHGDSCKYWLSNQTYQWGDRIESLAGRPEVFFHENAVHALNKVFKDFITEDTRNQNNQNVPVVPLRDLLKALNGLALNHDFNSLDSETIYELIPNRFRGGKEVLSNWRR